MVQLRRAALALFALALASILACEYGARPEEAKAALSGSLHCPEGWLDARQRTNLRIVHFACLAQASFLAVEEKERRGALLGFRWADVKDLKCGAPPPEIASNPGRLQLWLELREKQFWLFAGGGADDIFEVKGCGAHRFVNCLDRANTRHGGHPCQDVGDVNPLTANGPVPIPVQAGGS